MYIYVYNVTKFLRSEALYHENKVKRWNMRILITCDRRDYSLLYKITYRTIKRDLG